MIKQQGFSLIELVIFMVVIGIVASGLLLGLNQALMTANTPSAMSKASFLANARLQVILAYRTIKGFSSLTADPCSPAVLTICTPLNTYATNNGLNVSATISGTNPTKTITVTVSGSGNATTSASTYNYAND